MPDPVTRFTRAMAAFGDADYETAIAEAAPLAEDGYAPAVNLLVSVYGRYVRNDDACSHWLERLRSIATDGDATAQWELSSRLRFGDGVAVDALKGVELLRSAADGGHPEAMYELSEALLGGNSGVEEDLIESGVWFRRALAAGHPDALCGRGMFLLDGMSPEEQALGFRLIEEAAERGSGRAEEVLEWEREIVEVRVSAQFASSLFSRGQGTWQDRATRVLQISKLDAVFGRVGEFDHETRRDHGRPFVLGWRILRRYTRGQMSGAQLFQLRVVRRIEAAGEQFGTTYDESRACHECGSGAEQTGPLRLDVDGLPEDVDFVRTIANEILVSPRAAAAFERAGLTGIDLEPVRHGSPANAAAEAWRQLTVRTATAVIAPPTRIGVDPFDRSAQGAGRCIAGDLLGRRLLSEVSIDAGTRGNDDVVATRQFVGERRGLARPRRLILVSQRCRRIIESANLKGLTIEVAHLAE